MQENLSFKEQIDKVNTEAEQEIKEIKTKARDLVDKIIEDAIENALSLPKNEQLEIISQKWIKEEDIIRFLEQFRSCPEKISPDVQSYIVQNGTHYINGILLNLFRGYPKLLNKETQVFIATNWNEEIIFSLLDVFREWTASLLSREAVKIIKWREDLSNQVKTILHEMIPSSHSHDIS